MRMINGLTDAKRENGARSKAVFCKIRDRAAEKFAFRY